MAKRILLVENEKSCPICEFGTAKEGFLVDLAETGQDGLALAKDVDYDLLLLNYDLQVWLPAILLSSWAWLSQRPSLSFWL